MTNINLLKDNKNPKKGKGLLNLLRKKSNKSEAPIDQKDKKEPEVKIRKPISKPRAFLIFLLPILACVLLENFMQEEMLGAFQKLTQKLDEEKSKFQSMWKEAPPLGKWQTRHQNLLSARETLSSFAPMEIRSARECIQQMSDALPPEVWIKRFSIHQNVEKQLKIVEVEGFAFTSETVLFFLSKLKDKPFFRNVTLKYSEPTLENGIQEHRFLMNSSVSQKLFDAFNTAPWRYNKQRGWKYSVPLTKTPAVWALGKQPNNFVNFLGIQTKEILFNTQ